MRNRYRIAVLVLTLVLLVPAAALAMDGFKATLSGANENPPNPSPATGTGVFLFDGVNKLYYHISFSGLVAPQTASHIHRGAIAVNGPVIHNIGIGSPLDGIINLSAADVADLLGGNYYYNVHSTTYPGGEIRGQLGADPTPARASTWGRIKALYREK